MVESATMSSILLYFLLAISQQAMPRYALQALGAENKRHARLIPFKCNAAVVPFNTIARIVT